MGLSAAFIDGGVPISLLEARWEKASALGDDALGTFVGTGLKRMPVNVDGLGRS